MSPSYWAEALATTCYLLNRCPSSSIHNEVPYTRLHRKSPAYDHLHVFGCLSYPNLHATSAHKLAPCSTVCVLLGYLTAHKGYRCLDMSTRHIIISRHIIFDEFRFPFADVSSSFDFLVDDNVDIVPCSTNHAAPPRPMPTPAPFFEDDEQPLPPLQSAGPGGRGLVPPSGPTAPTPGGHGSVPPPRSAALQWLHTSDHWTPLQTIVRLRAAYDDHGYTSTSSTGSFGASTGPYTCRRT